MAAFWPLNLLLEVGLGGLALTLSARLVPRLLRRAFSVAVIVILVFIVAYSINFSVLSPRGYFSLHRVDFDRVSALVRDGKLGDSQERYGERLPVLVAHISADGRASDRSEGGPNYRRPAIFLPQWFGLIDNAGGYVYFEGEPTPETFVDLYGQPVYLAKARRLGGGWWWAP